MGKTTGRENTAAFWGFFWFFLKRVSRENIETYRPVVLTLIVEK